MSRLVVLMTVCAVTSLVLAGCGRNEPPGSRALEVDRQQVIRRLTEHLGNLSEKEIAIEADKLVDAGRPKAMDILTKRLAAFGADKADVRAGGRGQIDIQLPRMSSSSLAEIKTHLPRTGFFEIRMVHALNDQLVAEVFEAGQAPIGFSIVEDPQRHLYRRTNESGSLSMTPAQLIQVRQFIPPVLGYDLLLEERREGGQIVFVPFFVRLRRELSGDEIRDAQLGETKGQRTRVRIDLSNKGIKTFSRITADFAPGGARNPEPGAHRRLAMVLDGIVLYAPIIREMIGGNMELTGWFDSEQAPAIAVLLRCGALPVPLKWIAPN